MVVGPVRLTLFSYLVFGTVDAVVLSILDLVAPLGNLGEGFIWWGVGRGGRCYVSTVLDHPV